MALFTGPQTCSNGFRLTPGGTLATFEETLNASILTDYLRFRNYCSRANPWSSAAA